MGEASINSQNAISRQFIQKMSQDALFLNGSQGAFVQCLYRQYTEIFSLLYLSFFLYTVVAGSPSSLLLQSFNFGNNCCSFFCFGRGDREFLYLLVTCKGWEGSRDHLYWRLPEEGKDQGFCH